MRSKATASGTSVSVSVTVPCVSGSMTIGTLVCAARSIKTCLTSVSIQTLETRGSCGVGGATDGAAVAICAARARIWSATVSAVSPTPDASTVEAAGVGGGPA